MLDVANKYENELRNLLIDTWYDERYMFYTGCYSELYKSSDSNWNNRQFVSKSKDGCVLGLISYSINRANECVDGLSAINFSNDKLTFGIDLMNTIKDIFDKFRFRKLIFNVVVGNPIEPSYDKTITRYGGRIVGIFKEDCRLMDNKFYDSKTYEILRDEYIKSKQRNRVKLVRGVHET